MAESITIVPETAGLPVRAAALALRVADVIDSCVSDGPGADQASGFLRAWADSVPYDEPSGDPFVRTAAAYGLSADECDLLVLAGLPDEHEGIATTLRSMHPHAEPRPTVGLAALVLGGTDARGRVRSLLTGGAVTRHHLLHMTGRTTYFERSLHLADGIWETWHGDDGWPVDLVRVAMEPIPAGLEGWVASPEVAAAVRAVRADLPVTVLVVHEDERVAASRAAAVAQAAGRMPVAARLGPGDCDRLAQLGAQAVARAATPVVFAVTAPDEPVGELALPQVPGAFIVCAAPGTVRSGADRALMLLPTGLVAARDQRVAWIRAVPQLAASAAALAARHPMDPAMTATLTADARLQAGPLDLADVTRLVRARAAASMPTGAVLTTPQVSWEQVVLPAPGALQLRDAVARLDHQDVVLDGWGLRHRAHAVPGARLLLTGSPGTGKSLAAAAVATAAKTDLLVVDVSRIVSKWLGETEKNLAAVFEAAERTQAVLLLDEADALFGTRTEISDAHDRYANLETAYLLQRLDRFEGLVILTTNLRANIDVAFLRRVDFVVEFPLPDEQARQDLWALHLPTGQVDDDVDVPALARLYAVPGAWIRNSVVAAAYTAASTGGLIGQAHLVAAIRREFGKAALPFPGEPLRRKP